MTALFVALTILFFLALDTIQTKVKARKKVEQKVHYSEIGLSMCDGGEKVERVKNAQLKLF